MTTQERIGKRIREIRILKGLSQQNMADSLDIALSTYSDIENGRVKNLTLNRIEQVCTELEVPVETILQAENFNLNIQNLNGISNGFNTNSYYSTNNSDYETRLTRLENQYNEVLMKLIGFIDTITPKS